MVETSSSRDAFARRGAPATGGIGSGTDHFKREGGKAAAVRAAGDRFRSSAASGFDPVRPKEDAFAKKSGGQKAAARKPDALKPAAKVGARKPEAPKSEKSRPEVRTREAVFAAAAVEPMVKRAALQVVPSEARAEPQVRAAAVSADELMFGPADRTAADRPVQVKAESPAPQRPAAKSSSLVLVTGGGLATAAAVETLDKPAPVEAPVVPKAETPAPPPVTPERPRSGGGDGGSSGSGGDGAVARRKGGIDQDDIAGIVFGVVIFALLLLWLMRGKDGNDEIAGGDPLLSTQFAATDTGLPETFTPLADPFGDEVVDLRPKGPIPEAQTEAAPPPADAAPSGGTETAQLEAVPAPTPTPAPAPARPAAPPAVVAPPPVAAAPATPAAAPGLTSHAWFCTGSAELSPAARSELLGSIAAFRPHAGEPLVVHAFADTRGTSAFNLALSGERARVVADFLRANGLVVTEFEGKGELEGLADGRNCANQRRADVFFKAGSEYRPSAACGPPEEKSAAVCG